MQTRTLTIKQGDAKGECVAYIMSRDQRVSDNHALVAAQKHALDLQLPLVVIFNLLPNLGVRGYEHYAFMLEGLQEASRALDNLHIPFILTHGEAEDTLPRVFADLKAAAVYFDFSPFSARRALIKQVSNDVPAAYVVDTHNIVPLWIASDKQEFAAHTFRPKIHRNLATYMQEPEQAIVHGHQLARVPRYCSFEQAWQLVEQLPKRGIHIDLKSGEAAARHHLELFIHERLTQYALGRNDPTQDLQSDLSPYLHFGQISSLRVALEVLYASDATLLLYEQAKMANAGLSPSMIDGMNALFEEMIVRKELSDNFCFYNDNHRSLSGAPAWAQLTLSQHTHDKREHTYNRDQFEQAQTHDPAWNAAQKQLLKTGKMHGYMRMYWAKKILEWTEGAEQAIEHAIYLNDAYSIDGGDPNGYVGILWSIGGLHDRPWTERPVFGKIRYMNAAGLKRKFDIDKYIANWSD